MKAFGLTHGLDHGHKPIDVFNFKTQTAFPFGVEQLFIGFGQFSCFDRPRVVGLHPHGVDGGGVFLVSRHAARHEFREMRGRYSLQHFFAVEHFKLNCTCVDQIDVVALSTRFIDGSVHDAVATGTPSGDLHTVFFFKRIYEGLEVFFCNGSVKRDAAFQFGSSGQLGCSVWCRTFEQGHIGCALCLSQAGQAATQTQTQGRQMNELSHSGSCETFGIQHAVILC